MSVEVFASEKLGTIRLILLRMRCSVELRFGTILFTLSNYAYFAVLQISAYSELNQSLRGRIWDLELSS